MRGGQNAESKKQKKDRMRGRGAGWRRRCTAGAAWRIFWWLSGAGGLMHLQLRHSLAQGLYLDAAFTHTAQHARQHEAGQGE